jgi:hypothetical protein
MCYHEGMSSGRAVRLGIAVPLVGLALFAQSAGAVGYPRPKGATPVSASLVPAFQPCTAPNARHAPPLSFGSCEPPLQSSPQLTVGTPDANGVAANSTGAVRLRVFYCPACAIPIREDVQIAALLSDVRLTSDLSDYTGRLSAIVDVQLTDSRNGPNADEPATVQPFPIKIPVQCVATDDPATGGDCAVSTSMSALVPGAVVENGRAVWELGDIRVYDGGGSLFAHQGLFVP